MRKGTIFCIALLIVILAYIFGCIIPFKAFIPNIDWNKQISPGELVYYFICTLQAIGTIGAVIVALFNDNIKSYFRKPKLSINLHNNDICEELDEHKDGSRKAKRYHNSIDIVNEGNTTAENCEIYIESISFTGLGMKTSVELLQNDYFLSWSNSEQKNSTYIPVNGKKSFQLYEILPAEEQGTPGGGNRAKIPAQLVIGSYKVPSEYCGGKWNIMICLYSPSSKLHKFQVTIDWDGNWEDRQMEMKNKVKNSINTVL